MKWRVALLSVIAAILWSGSPVSAHPADQHQLFHSIALSTEGVDVTWTIVVAPLLSPALWKQADASGDDVVSPAEAELWALPVVSLLNGRLDDSAGLFWQLDGIAWPASFDAMQSGDEAIVIRLSAAWPALLTGEHGLTLTDSFDSRHSANWFVLEPGDTFEVLDASADQATRFVVHFRQVTAAGGESRQSNLGQPANTGAPRVPVTRSATLQRLTDLLQTRPASPALYVLALAVALALGALHALTPGHGKTVVAAYLVGSRGTSLHAVGLGAVTTLTHTGTVVLLGVIALLASRTIVPNDLFPLLEVASGALIVLLGANLLYRRWVEFQQGGAHHRHGHDHPHRHSHDGSYASGETAASRDHDLMHDHTHGEVGPAIPGRVTWRSLLMLGVSGGLVPCPDAIAILLLAIAIQRIGLGLALIVSFSLGLAIVLIAIGLAMLHSRRLFARLSAFERVSPVLPMVSAAIVLMLGIALTARAL